MARLIATHAYDPLGAPRDVVLPGEPIRLSVEPDRAGAYTYKWHLLEGMTTDADPSGPTTIVYCDNVPPGPHEILVTLYSADGDQQVPVDEARLSIHVLRPAAGRGPLGGRAVEGEVLEEGQARAETSGVEALFDNGVLPVGLRRSPVPLTPDVALWMVIRRSTQDLSFPSYREAIDLVLCGIRPGTQAGRARAALALDELQPLGRRRALPFAGVDAYYFLKLATEAFVVSQVGVMAYNSRSNQYETVPFTQEEIREATARLGTGRNAITATELDHYLVTISTNNPRVGALRTLPYLALVRQKLRDVGIKSSMFANFDQGTDGVPNFSEECEGILAERLARPPVLELIHDYWLHEAGLVQTMNAVTRRFQNFHGSGERDPLAELEIDPLRPLSHLLWGFVRDAQHRLSLAQLNAEFNHVYGHGLLGKAVGRLRPADIRSKFLDGFHGLLHLCARFYKEAANTVVTPDAFPLFNALREVHLELSQGNHNQFSDLTSTSRQEILMQKWLLARPEFREFLPSRVMVTEQEPWMSRVDSMKSLQGWSRTLVMHFHNLAVTSEQLILSIRLGNWNGPDANSDSAANWAYFWRQEVQTYLHAYKAVTGVDLAAEVSDSQRESERATQPSLLLLRQLEQQRRGLPGAPAESPHLAPRRRLPSS